MSSPAGGVIARERPENRKEGGSEMSFISRGVDTGLFRTGVKDKVREKE